MNIIFKHFRFNREPIDCRTPSYIKDPILISENFKHLDTLELYDWLKWDKYYIRYVVSDGYGEREFIVQIDLIDKYCLESVYRTKSLTDAIHYVERQYNNEIMTTEQNEINSAEWRKKNLSKNTELDCSDNKLKRHQENG